MLENERRSQRVEGRAANHVQVAFTASEFLLDFGQAYGEKGDPLIHTRIIMSPSLARTLSQMMREIVEKYEKLTGLGTAAPV